VTVGPVPAALAAHIGGKGVMVRNVVVDSPADRAGIAQYDVLAAVDGKAVASVGGLIRAIAAHEPGAEVALDVIHKGKVTKAKVKLAKPFAAADVKYRYETDEPAEVFRDKLKMHGGVWRKGEKGWQYHPLPDERTREWMKRFLGQAPSDVEVEVRRGGKAEAFKLVKTVNGKTVTVEGDAEGTCKVTRTQKGEDGRERTVTKTYESLAELAEADREAYELVRSVRASSRRGAGRAWVTTPGGYQGRLSDLLRDPSHLGPLQGFMRFGTEAHPGGGAIVRVAPSKARPAVTRKFDVDASGRVTVTIHDGDDEIVLELKSVQELRAKHPGLYRHYRRLLDAK
jgi:hypothetical protein